MQKNNLESDYRILEALKKNPNISQRDLAKELGYSLGKVNYCIKGLIDIGYVKIQNFNKSSKKMNYLYILTPKGVQQKTAITKKFIIKKKQEYDKLNSYINKELLI